MIGSVFAFAASPIAYPTTGCVIVLLWIVVDAVRPSSLSPTYPASKVCPSMLGMASRGRTFRMFAVLGIGSSGQS